MKKTKYNIMFDLAASIETEKEFEDITVAEFVAAVRDRLDAIEEEGCVDAFGFCDSYEVEVGDQ